MTANLKDGREPKDYSRFWTSTAFGVPAATAARYRAQLRQQREANVVADNTTDLLQPVPSSGYFDSSFDLQQGLLVMEAPLESWLMPVFQSQRSGKR